MQQSCHKPCTYFILYFQHITFPAGRFRFNYLYHLGAGRRPYTNEPVELTNLFHSTTCRPLRTRSRDLSGNHRGTLARSPFPPHSGKPCQARLGGAVSVPQPARGHFSPARWGPAAISPVYSFPSFLAWERRFGPSSAWAHLHNSPTGSSRARIPPSQGLYPTGMTSRGSCPGGQVPELGPEPCPRRPHDPWPPGPGSRPPGTGFLLMFPASMWV